ncbi:SGNH/GDSL hydrolase family protein [Luteimonas vadosa]
MPPAGAAPRSLSFLALGDSYTIGEGVDADGRWPVQLAARLRADGIALADPRIIATTGWTTDELSAAMDQAGPLGRFDFVSLLIGVNNQYRGRSAGEYRDEFTALLARAIELAGGRNDRVLVLGIPDWGATRFGAASGRDLAQVSRELDDYNAVARELCEARDVAFVDVSRPSRARGDEDAMLVDDGLHPSAAMYRLWVELALPVARRLLGDGR